MFPLTTIKVQIVQTLKGVPKSKSFMVNVAYLWSGNKQILYVSTALCTLLVFGIHEILIRLVSFQFDFQSLSSALAQSSTYVTVRWKMRHAAPTGEHMIYSGIL